MAIGPQDHGQPVEQSDAACTRDATEDPDPDDRGGHPGTDVDHSRDRRFSPLGTAMSYQDITGPSPRVRCSARRLTGFVDSSRSVGLRDACVEKPEGEATPHDPHSGTESGTEREGKTQGAEQDTTDSGDRGHEHQTPEGPGWLHGIVT